MSAGFSNYTTGTRDIEPAFGTYPAKGESRTDPTTGNVITRIADRAELSPVSDYGMIVYSRFTPTNTGNQYAIIHHSDSTSASLYRLSDKVNLGVIRRDATNPIGEAHEIRWDYTGNYPNRVYFVYTTKFYYMDVVDGNGSPTLIRDFAADFPTAVKIINDVEGDSSADSRYWAWQVLGPYNGQVYPRIAFITYDKTTNTILGTMLPGDVTPTQNAANWAVKMPAPNMVDISPDGSKVILNYGRSYAGSGTADFAGTGFDGTKAWDLNFTNPVYASKSEGHAGWAYNALGHSVFVSENPTTDRVESCDVNSVTATMTTGDCINIFDTSSTGYAGEHFSRMYNPAYKGWILVSTSTPTGYPSGYPPRQSDYTYTQYAKIEANGYIYRATTGGTSGASVPAWPTTKGATVADGAAIWTNYGKTWADNQIYMMEIKDMAENPRMWRITPSYNSHYGYRSEGSAALSHDGKSVFWSANWGTTNSPLADGQVDAFMTELPSDWYGHFGGTLDPPPTGPAPVTTASKAPGRYLTTQQLSLTPSAGTAKYCFGAGCTPSINYTVPLRVPPMNTAGGPAWVLNVQSTDGSNVEPVQTLEFRKQRQIVR